MIRLDLPGLEDKFPTILSLSGEDPKIRLKLDISSDLVWFRSHFPGFPVLAGVVQLHWAVSVSMALFSFDKLPLEIKRLKYKRLVTPPLTLELALERVSAYQVQFEYSSQDHIHSLGRLIFEEIPSC